jgi:hypothetical protein
MTVVIQIGNSDNKLSQVEWSTLIQSVDGAADAYSDRIHFKGGSAYTSIWQNACWVCEVRGEMMKPLLQDLSFQARKFNQDSIAVTTGETKFIKGQQ